MKRIRCFLVGIALLASLGGSFLLQGMGSASMASATSSHHASTSAAVAFSQPPCGTVVDC